MNRRDFLAAAAVTAGATCTTPVTAGRPGSTSPASVPKIDTHQHLWDLKLFKPPWLSGAPEVLARSYVTSDYLSATRGLNIVKTVYMEVDVAVQDQDREAKHVVELSMSDQHPTAGAIISGRPNSAGFEKYIRRHAGSPYVRGVRQVLHPENTARGLCLQNQFVQSVRLLGRLGKTFDVCIRPMELADAAELASKCPDTTIVLDHCGNADPKAFLPSSKEKPWHDIDTWKRGIAAVAARKNTVCKISGIVARAPEGWNSDHLAEIINFCLNTFGPDRVVFGGDWPVCLLGGPYASWVAALNEVISERPRAEQKKLYHDNAIRVYGVK